MTYKNAVVSERKEIFAFICGISRKGSVRYAVSQSLPKHSGMYGNKKKKMDRLSAISYMTNAINKIVS